MIIIIKNWMGRVGWGGVLVKKNIGMGFKRFKDLIRLRLLGVKEWSK